MLGSFVRILFTLLVLICHWSVVSNSNKIFLPQPSYLPVVLLSKSIKLNQKNHHHNTNRMLITKEKARNSLWNAYILIISSHHVTYALKTQKVTMLTILFLQPLISIYCAFFSVHDQVWTKLHCFAREWYIL